MEQQRFLSLNLDCGNQCRFKLISGPVGRRSIGLLVTGGLKFTTTLSGPSIDKDKALDPWAPTPKGKWTNRH
ncbi:hypothetical protein TNCV_3416601 [Trichonephila clavipes]|nr:hypothetical protein TNCV_3416601 [Trichonephila clavipes]